MPERHLVPRLTWRLVSRLAVNLAALTQKRRRRVLVAPAVPLVGPMDLPYESHSATWDELAARLTA
jgi:hypothetical protein